MSRRTVAEAGREPLERSGSNPTRVRAWNERLVLDTIRRLGPLPKAELARLTGLSAQTVSVIVRQLERDGLLIRQPRLRGRVGQPSVPFALAPDGAFSLGFKIGRRSADLVLLDFIGGVRATRRCTYAFPRWPALCEFAVEGLQALAGELEPAARARIVGVGVAMPFEMWNWPEETGAPAAELAHWREVDVAAELAARLAWPTFLCNDASAACGAELVFGIGGRWRDSVYFHIGAFIGGGIVLGGSLYLGTRNNAGVLAPLPVALPGGGATQLLRRASLYLLERAWREAGLDPSRLWLSPEQWDEALPLVDRWLDDAAEALAQAVAAACAVIDFEAAIVDGAMPRSMRHALVERTRRRFESLDRKGLSPVVIEEGRVGAFARAIGGATLPLLANFALDREVLVADSQR